LVASNFKVRLKSERREIELREKREFGDTRREAFRLKIKLNAGSLNRQIVVENLNHGVMLDITINPASQVWLGIR